MNTETTYTSSFGNFVADALPAERASFIRKTYIHLAIAVLAFGVMVSYLVTTGAGLWIAQRMVGGYSWLIVLMVFMGVSWLAQSWARSSTSVPLQYMGLALFTVAESIIFLPLLFMAAASSDGMATIFQAGVVTGGLFAGLTAVVLMTRKDFSFLGPILAIGGFIALGFIVSGIVFGFGMGSIFAFIMVAFAGAAILYETSNMLHHYKTNQHVAASLGLFASVALLFWYILQIFMGGDD